MVPWSIALLAIFYAVIATVSASMVWKVMLGESGRPFFWPALWMVLSAGATYGLAMLKPWGRRLAVWTSVLLMAAILCVAARLVANGRPGIALLTAIIAGVQMVAIRYLGRSSSKGLFAEHAEFGMRSAE